MLVSCCSGSYNLKKRQYLLTTLDWLSGLSPYKTKDTCNKQLGRSTSLPLKWSAVCGLRHKKRHYTAERVPYCYYGVWLGHVDVLWVPSVKQCGRLCKATAQAAICEINRSHAIYVWTISAAEGRNDKERQLTLKTEGTSHHKLLRNMCFFVCAKSCHS